MELFTVSFNEFNEYFWRNNYRNYSIDVSSINEPINLINKIKEIYTYIVIRRNFDFLRFFLKDEDTFLGKYLLIAWDPKYPNIINLGFSYLDDCMKKFIITNSEISIDNNRIRIELINHDLHDIDTINLITKDNFLLNSNSLYVGDLYDSPISHDRRVSISSIYLYNEVYDLVEMSITTTEVTRIRFLILYYTFESEQVYLKCDRSDYPIQFNHYSLLLSAIK